MEDMTALTHADDTRVSIAPAGARQAFTILRAAYVAAPLLAGVDKFFNALVDWDKYLAPQFIRSRRRRRFFMRAVGLVEIAAGLTVAVRPRLGGYLVAGWLGGIIGNLTLGRRDYDVALRDVGLLLGAVAMTRLRPSPQPAVPAPLLH